MIPVEGFLLDLRYLATFTLTTVIYALAILSKPSLFVLSSESVCRPMYDKNTIYLFQRIQNKEPIPK